MHEYVTYTTWRVKPGLEAAFVQSWEDWAYWSRVEGLVDQPRLLRDADDPLTFVSFGRWADASSIRAWRSLPGYQERVGRLRALVDSFEPRTLEVLIDGGYRAEAFSRRSA